MKPQHPLTLVVAVAITVVLSLFIGTIITLYLQSPGTAVVTHLLITGLWLTGPWLFSRQEATD